ncbi:MAG: hypothetical protein HFJ42_02690 [Clostridia bacterium]|nr:hypothetical protein [Clostridia bacterium]
MEKDKIYQILYVVKKIKVTKENKEDIENIRKLIKEEEYIEAVKELQRIQKEGKIQYKETEEQTKKQIKRYKKQEIRNDKYDDSIDEEILKEQKEDIIFPKQLSNRKLEQKFIALLLANPKAISMYYIEKKDCYFESAQILNLYKSVVFVEGQEYTPEIAKSGFNFPKQKEEIYDLKDRLKCKVINANLNFEKVYVDLRKLFEIRKSYIHNPIEETKEMIADIVNYELYDKMTIEDTKSAIEQITATEKYKRSVLNDDITNFLISGENNLTQGLSLPFKILTSVFKGIRKGETLSYAMPSNSGKSRFTINLAANLALLHNKKVLIISNEMSEEKMKLCLITTILNNEKIQKLHNQKLCKTEGEILEFKFRPNKDANVEKDEEGFILKKQSETQREFAKRLEKVSSEFNSTIEATNWLEEQVRNSIYFVNLTNHTNDELEKVILNYYYKEQIEYVFYDTLKTDTANIGNGEEIKRTATILSNLAQDLNIFIASSLQLAESETLPINVNVNDLAVSRTVKEVLDILCLIKQIHNEDLNKYEYSLNEVDTKFYDLEPSKDPDVRYYACVVDKNRAGAKPKVVFKLNLAYNYWEELGYLRLK